MKEMISKILSYFTQGHERSKRAVQNIVSMFFLKGISVLFSLLLIPLTINYVSSAQYGIWLTLSSIVTWASLFDIGLGNGLRNKFTEAIAEGNTEKAKIYVSTTYFVLSSVMFLMFLLFLVINPYLDWCSILNAPKVMSRELNELAIIVFFSFFSQFVLQLVTTLLTSIQKPALASIYSTLSQILILLVIYILTKTVSASLVYLGLTMGGIQILVLIGFSMWFFKHDLKEYIPSYKFVKLKYVKDLIGIGLKFFIIQIAVIIVFQTNNLVIIHLFGPEKVTVYNIVFKYLSIITMIVTIVITPFWSAFTEAYVKKDIRWMFNVVKKIQLFWYFTLILTVILVLFSPFLYRIWLKDSVVIPFPVTVAMGGYVVVNAWTMIYSFILNGIGKLKIQFYSAIILCVLNIPITIFSGFYFGLTGLIVAQTLSAIIISSWWMPIQIKKVILHRAKGIWNS